MTPVDAIAEIERLQFLVTVAASAAIGCALAFYRYGRQVDRRDQRGCLECSHCRAEYRKKVQEAEAASEQKTRDNLRALGLTETQIEDYIRRWKGRR